MAGDDRLDIDRDALCDLDLMAQDCEHLGRLGRVQVFEVARPRVGDIEDLLSAGWTARKNVQGF